MEAKKRKEVKKAVREVLREMGLLAPEQTSASSVEPKTPRVFFLFHCGGRKLPEALAQVRQIEDLAEKTAVYMGEGARRLICTEELRDQAGCLCFLNTCKPEGLEKVLSHCDFMVLPTLSLHVAAKVARLTTDDTASALVTSALLQGKKVLAATDGFLYCEALVNENLKAEIDRILKTLESFGLVLCRTEELSATFQRLASDFGELSRAGAEQGRAPAPEPEETDFGELSRAEPALSLITAREVTRAAEEGRSVLRLAPGGKVTPLARDVARDNSVKIVQT